MEGLQAAGVIAFIYGVLWASSTVKDAKRTLGVEYLESLRGIERVTLANSLGPLLPLVGGLLLVSYTTHDSLGIAIAAIILTVVLVALKGVLHARRMRGVGVPRAYRVSYRRAHAIRAAALALCAATLVHSVLR